MRPRCIELHRVLKKTGSFYYHCDWHASHYVKLMLDQILGELVGSQCRHFDAGLVQGVELLLLLDQRRHVAKKTDEVADLA